MNPLLRIQDLRWEETLTGEGEPVLLCRCVLPECSRLEYRAQRRIDRYYRHMEERFQHWCRRSLFPRAERQRQALRAAARPFDPWTAALFYQAEQQPGALLRVEVVYQRQQGAAILHHASCTDLWSLETGLPAL